MGWSNQTGTRTYSPFAFGLGFLFARLIRYHRRYILLRMSEEEARELLDLLETWTEGYQELAEEADDDEVQGLFESFSAASDLRLRLWKEVRNVSGR